MIISRQRSDYTLTSHVATQHRAVWCACGRHCLHVQGHKANSSSCEWKFMAVLHLTAPCDLCCPHPTLAREVEPGNEARLNSLDSSPSLMLTPAQVSCSLQPRSHAHSTPGLMLLPLHALLVILLIKNWHLHSNMGGAIYKPHTLIT